MIQPKTAATGKNVKKWSEIKIRETKDKNV